MTQITRRNVLRIGAAGLALPLMGSLAFGQDGPFKIGFVNVGPKDENGWTYGHWVGAQALEAEFGDKIEVTFVESVPEGPDCERVLRELAQQGNKRADKHSRFERASSRDRVGIIVRSIACNFESSRSGSK